MTELDDAPLHPEWFIEIRNHNEERVRKILPEVLKLYVDHASQQDLRDVYACALNKLPARYVQPGSNPDAGALPEEVVRDAVEGAVITILIRPRSDRSTTMLKREAAEKRDANRGDMDNE